MKLDKGRYSILVVEDNPGDYLLVEDYLTEHIQNPELTHVGRFKEAKTLLMNKGSFDLVLLDLSLPDVSREHLIEEVRQYSQVCPIVILTGYPDLDFATKSLAHGVSDYLVKDTITPLILYKSVIYSIERFRYLQSLIESEKRYTDLFHLSPAPMWVYEIETLRFLDVNEAAIRHYGYSRDEFLKLSVQNIRHPDDFKLYLERNKEHLNNETVRHFKKDGQIIHVDIQTTKIEYKNVAARLVLVTDMTEKLNHLRAIEDQNKRLRDIAWTQSHVVRAPVARLIALVHMLQNEHLQDDDMSLLLNAVQESTLEIDTIIRDIVDKSQAAITPSPRYGR
jgi:PAS domain S-box-containing protein